MFQRMAGIALTRLGVLIVTITRGIGTTNLTSDSSCWSLFGSAAWGYMESPGMLITPNNPSVGGASIYCRRVFVASGFIVSFNVRFGAISGPADVVYLALYQSSEATSVPGWVCSSTGANGCFTSTTRVALELVTYDVLRTAAAASGTGLLGVYTSPAFDPIQAVSGAGTFGTLTSVLPGDVWGVSAKFDPSTASSWNVYWSLSRGSDSAHFNATLGIPDALNAAPSTMDGTAWLGFAGSTGEATQEVWITDVLWQGSSQSGTPSSSASPTATQSSSASASSSSSSSASPALTLSGSASSSATPSATATASTVQTSTQSVTSSSLSTSSRSPSSTSTKSGTQSVSRSPSRSPTTTSTPSGSPTPSRMSRTQSSTPSHSRTPSRSGTQSSASTESSTSSQSASPSYSSSQAACSSCILSPSSTSTGSASSTGSAIRTRLPSSMNATSLGPDVGGEDPLRTTLVIAVSSALSFLLILALLIGLILCLRYRRRKRADSSKKQLPVASGSWASDPAVSSKMSANPPLVPPLRIRSVGHASSARDVYRLKKDASGAAPASEGSHVQRVVGPLPDERDRHVALGPNADRVRQGRRSVSVVPVSSSLQDDFCSAVSPFGVESQASTQTTALKTFSRVSFALDSNMSPALIPPQPPSYDDDVSPQLRQQYSITGEGRARGMTIRRASISGIGSPMASGHVFRSQSNLGSSTEIFDTASAATFQHRNPHEHGPVRMASVRRSSLSLAASSVVGQRQPQQPMQRQISMRQQDYSVSEQNHTWAGSPDLLAQPARDAWLGVPSTLTTGFGVPTNTESMHGAAAPTFQYDQPRRRMSWQPAPSSLLAPQSYSATDGTSWSPGAHGAMFNRRMSLNASAMGAAAGSGFVYRGSQRLVNS